jgi:hypothetical protein
LTRRFDIGPIVLALGAIALLIALFLDWFAAWNAWEVFEITDVLLAALAVAAAVTALGLLVPDIDYLDRRFLPWIVGAALILVLNQLLAPGVALDEAELGTGAWLALAGAVVMVIGAVLSLSRVSFSVAMEGRDRRRRVSAVDHRPPPTETGAPVARSSTSLLHPNRPEADEKS